MTALLIDILVIALSHPWRQGGTTLVRPGRRGWWPSWPCWCFHVQEPSCFSFLLTSPRSNVKSYQMACLAAIGINLCVFSCVLRMWDTNRLLPDDSLFAYNEYYEIPRHHSHKSGTWIKENLGSDLSAPLLLGYVVMRNSTWALQAIKISSLGCQRNAKWISCSGRVCGSSALECPHRLVLTYMNWEETERLATHRERVSAAAHKR